MAGRYFLSIVIPTFERREALDATLASIVEQDAFSDEIQVLVSDNCSSDGTDRMVLEKYASKYPNITYIRRPTNIGPDLNFHHAIADSSGEYVKLLNDNKPLACGALSVLVNALHRFQPVVVLTPGNLGSEAECLKCATFSGFIAIASVKITWLPAIGFKREAWDGIPDKLSGSGSNLIQTYFLLDALAQGGDALIINKHIVAGIPAQVKRGYNFFQVFVDNYLVLLARYVRTDKLSSSVFVRERNKLLTGFVVPWMRKIMLHRERYQFDVDNWLAILWRHYKFNPRFYLLPLFLFLDVLKWKFKEVSRA